jgi:hypothetical protein
MRRLLMLVFVTEILAPMGTLSADPIPILGASSNVTLFGAEDCGDHTHNCYENVSGSSGGELVRYDGGAEVFESPQFAFAHVGSGPGQTVRADANLLYYFEWSGPSGVLIPTDIDMVLKAFSDGLPRSGGSVLGNAEVDAGSASSPGGGFERLTCSSVSCPSNEFSGTLQFLAIPNTIYYVGESASAIAQAFDSASASASVDPFIHIDSSFAGAGNYQLLLSDGIANNPIGTTGSSVPEPSSLPLAGLALGALALLRRKARP